MATKVWHQFLSKRKARVQVGTLGTPNSSLTQGMDVVRARGIKHVGNMLSPSCPLAMGGLALISLVLQGCRRGGKKTRAKRTNNGVAFNTH